MAGERTEEATPKRKEEVRRRGQTARSPDLTTAAVLLAGLYGIKILAGTLWAQLSGLVVGNILLVGTLDKTASPMTQTNVLGTLVTILPPLLGILIIAAVAVSVLQGGFIFAPGLLTKWDHLSPIAGMKRIISTQSLVRFGMTLGKFVVVALVATIVIYGRKDEIVAIGMLDLGPAAMLMLDLIWDLALKTVLAMSGLGIADWLWQRRSFLQSTRMTKQEVQEEMRQSEGDPHVRAQLKGKRMQFLQQMMQDVKKADVVVTNPTHFAVALKYDPETMAAPIVIAKGQDYLALRIRAAAAEAGVPVLENPPLARGLYKLVKVGQEIPAELYVAVAEVLAFVFRLRQGTTAA